MKKVLTYAIGAALASVLLFSSCQKPHYVLPTAERDGFTSLSVYITSGEYNGKELAKFTVTDEMIQDGRIEVAIPWFYPESSDNTTITYLSALRVRAELDKNCFVEPALTILDFNEENEFVYTDAQGTKYPIIITGKRKKSDNATLESFGLVGMFDGFVDDDNRIIYLYTNDDLSACTAEATPSAHSKIVTDLGESRNYNEPQEIVLESHSGKKITYTTEKAAPTKIRNGFNVDYSSSSKYAKSFKQLFNIDPKTIYGTPDYVAEGLAPSLAAIGGHLVICMGDGSTPIYVSGTKGEKQGEIVLGEAEPGGVANDDSGHMLISNKLEGKGTLKLWKTSSVTEAPELFYSFADTVALPAGNKMKIYGNVESNAQIVLSCDGVPNVTSSSKLLVLDVKGGDVDSVRVVDLTDAGISWGSYNKFCAAPAGSKAEDGIFVSGYQIYGSETSSLVYLDGSNVIKQSATTTASDASNYNCGTIDVKSFNNEDYMILLNRMFFPAWGYGPELFVYKVTDVNALKGVDILATMDYDDKNDRYSVPEDNPTLVANYLIEDFANAQNKESYLSSGDVTMAASEDGFKLFFYYLDQYTGTVGGFSVDCIKRN